MKESENPTAKRTTISIEGTPSDIAKQITKLQETEFVIVHNNGVMKPNETYSILVTHLPFDSSRKKPIKKVVKKIKEETNEAS